jgi:histone H3/H4
MPEQEAALLALANAMRFARSIVQPLDRASPHAQQQWREHVATVIELLAEQGFEIAPRDSRTPVRRSAAEP